MRRVQPAGPGGFLAEIPPMIRALMIACTVVWLAELATNLRPAWFWDLLVLTNNGVLRRFQLWTLVTYQFLHSLSGLGHLVFNLYALWLFGRRLELRWGGLAFLRFYLACGVGAGLLHVVVSRLFVPSQAGSVMGASGAILGLLMAYAMLWPHERILLMFVIPVTMRALVLITAVAELMFVWNANHGIANLAHLGGLLTGYLIMKHGFRLRQPFAPLAAGWGRLRRAFRRRHVKVVDKDWDSWLDRNDPDQDDRNGPH